MKDFLDLLNDEPELQAAARAAQTALNDVADASKAGADCIRLVLQWCQRDKLNQAVEAKQRRDIRRRTIFSGGDNADG